MGIDREFVAQLVEALERHVSAAETQQTSFEEAQTESFERLEEALRAELLAEARQQLSKSTTNLAQTVEILRVLLHSKLARIASLDAEERADLSAWLDHELALLEEAVAALERVERALAE